MDREQAHFEVLIRLADDHLVLGHRVSEWCGHAPMLEEDLSLPNMALDLIGQARNLYSHAGEVEGKGRGEDDLAYGRLEADYKNLLLVEKSNGDFAQTMLRQLLFAAFMESFWERSLSSNDPVLSAIAGKAVKEVAYHVRHSAEWVIRLGDGTAESHQRMVQARDVLFPYVDEMFECDASATLMKDAGVIPNLSEIRPEWDSRITEIFAAAKLDMPERYWPLNGGRQGRHGEEMGFLLAELQYMQRTYPGLSW